MTVTYSLARRLARVLIIAAVAIAGAAWLGSATALAAGEPESSAPPIVSGQAVVGEALQATHAAWSGSPTSYEDWWERCDASGLDCQTIIAGATGLDYTPTAADVGHALAFGEIAYNGAGQSKPAYSSATAPVLATPPRHFILVGPTGIPQFAYYLVEPTGRRPSANSWHHALHTVTVGVVDADVNPGQTIYFSPTAKIGVHLLGIARTLTPEGSAGKAFRVTASTPMQVRVVLPSAGRPFHPELSASERWVLGQLNRKRVRLHESPLRVSTILDKVASVVARDEAVRHRWPDPYFFSLGPSFGWPGDLTETSLGTVDAPLSRPADVLAHWDGKYTGESTGLWHEISWPFFSYVGIADGGGAWNLVLVAGCPATTQPTRACGLTNVTGM